MEPTTQTEAITIHNGATINGVQTDTQVIMKRQGFDKWPDAKTGLDEWEAKVKAMDCLDFGLKLKDMDMNSHTGGFRRAANNSDGFPMTKTGYNHLMSYIKVKEDNSVNNMLDMPPNIRAMMWNVYRARTEDRPIVIRTAMAGRMNRIIRAVVSEGHSQAHGDDLAVIEAFRSLATTQTQTKLRVIRQWDRTSAELILPAIAVQAKVGVTLYGRIAIQNSETKGGSYETLAGSMNLVCLNGMVRPGNESSFRVRHMGDIGYRIRQSIRVAVEGVSDHLHVFAHSYNQSFTKSRADVIEAFGVKHALPESTGTALAALWDVDGERSGGNTLAGLVNAVTRHAQALPVEQALKMEALAGQTLHEGLSSLIF